MKEELVRKRMNEQKELAKEEVKLKREFEKEQRIMRKVMQERQVMCPKKKNIGRRLACMNLVVQICYCLS